MLGYWIRPWPGENIIGEVVAISGEDLVCCGYGGVRFTVRMADLPKMQLSPPDSNDRDFRRRLRAARRLTGKDLSVS